MQASGLPCRALQCPTQPWLLPCLPAYYTTTPHRQSTAPTCSGHPHNAGQGSGGVCDAQQHRGVAWGEVGVVGVQACRARRQLSGKGLKRQRTHLLGCYCSPMPLDSLFCAPHSWVVDIACTQASPAREKEARPSAIVTSAAAGKGSQTGQLEGQHEWEEQAESLSSGTKPQTARRPACTADPTHRGRPAVFEAAL